MPVAVILHVSEQKSLWTSRIRVTKGRINGEGGKDGVSEPHDKWMIGVSVGIRDPQLWSTFGDGHGQEDRESRRDCSGPLFNLWGCPGTHLSGRVTHLDAYISSEYPFYIIQFFKLSSVPNDLRASVNEHDEQRCTAPKVPRCRQGTGLNLAPSNSFSFSGIHMASSTSKLKKAGMERLGSLESTTR